MLSQSFDRLFDIARRTGDKLIVHDPKTGYDMVIMGVDTYLDIIEKKSGVRHLTKEQMQDRINRDIAVWRSHNEKIKQDDLLYTLEQELSLGEVKNTPYLQDVEVVQVTKEYKNKTSNFSKKSGGVLETKSGLSPLGNIMKEYADKNNLLPFQSSDNQSPVVEPIHEYDKESPYTMRYEKPDITHMSSKESEYVLRDEKKEGFGVKKQDNMAGDFNDTEESSIYFEEPL